MLDLQAKLQHDQAAKQLQKVKNLPTFSPGTLVYLLAPSSSSLQMPSRKIRMDYVGPFSIKEVLDRSHFILMTLDNKQVPSVIHVSRIKLAYLRCGGKVITNIKDLTPEAKKSLQTTHAHDQQEIKHDSNSLQPNIYNIIRYRCKNGNLEALLDTESQVKHNLWLTVASCIPQDNLSNPSVKTVGSLAKFVRCLTV